MLKKTGDYPWSSYPANADGRKMELVTPHPTYLALGKTRDERQYVYREFCINDVKSSVISEIRQATNDNYVFGNDLFKKEIGGILGCKVTPGKAGRPPKKGGEN